MPSTPTRRRLLGAGGALLGSALAGCTSVGYTGDGRQRSPTGSRPATPTTGGTYADTPDGPEPYPERPDELTPESVRGYVEAFERARKTNLLHAPDVETLQVDCSAVHDTAAHGGHYALASCGGYANYADGVHADLGEAPSTYYVAPNLTVQLRDTSPSYVHCSEVFVSSDPAENFARECSGDDAKYQVYNFHPERHTLTATVEFLGASDTETVLEETYTVRPANGVVQHGVTYRRGRYRLTASLDTGAELTHEWEIRSAPAFDTPRLSVLITALGGLAVHRFPTGEV